MQIKRFVYLLAIPACLAAFTLPNYGALESLVIEPFHHMTPPVPTIPAPEITINEMVNAVARKHNVQAAFVKSIIKAESGFNQAALSPKGAIGLMQLMPETAAAYGVDPNVAAENVDGGAHYLSWLLARYKNRRNQLPLAIAAYNAGPGNVEKYRGIPPFRETRAYVKRVLGYFSEFGGELPRRSRPRIASYRRHTDTVAD